MPFAVIGSRDEVEINGKKIRARLYPWGTVEGKWTVQCRNSGKERFPEIDLTR